MNPHKQSPMTSVALLVTTSLFLLSPPRSFTAETIVTDFQGNGILQIQIPTADGSLAVEWSATPDGPWLNTWETLRNHNVTNVNISLQVPMFYRIKHITYAPVSNSLVPVVFNPADKATYLGNTNLYPYGYGTYQKGGPEYTYYMSRYEISNQEFKQFLNSAQLNPHNGLGTNMYFHTNGDVYMNTNRSINEKLFDLGSSRLTYSTNNAVGTRYQLSPSTPSGGGTYINHPISGVTWYGAVKYCNWLTIYTGRGDENRCYNEGVTASNWYPVTATIWNTGYFPESEREQLLQYQGFRLPMHSVGSLTKFNEYYKSAAWNGTSNSLFAFGRNVLTTKDANYSNSGDPFSDTTPVGYYDGSLHEWSGVQFQTTANANLYQIYDLCGNVSEWMNDHWQEGDVANFMMRGGNINNSVSSAQLKNESSSANASIGDRSTQSANIGFRVVAMNP